MSQINISHLTFCYDSSYENIFEDVSFQIDTDWKLGFTGRNGRGKTTFLHLLLESSKQRGRATKRSHEGGYEYTGNITSSVEFEYFPFPVKDKEKNTVDVAEEICPGYEYWELCRELSRLEVETDVLYRSFSTLSNGEQTKVQLALLFLRENRFLLIDEPTNHLDVEARTVVGSYLKKKKGFILVSHDRRLLDECVDHMLVINKTNIEVVSGNFSSWWDNKKKQDACEMAENERLKKDIRRLSEAAKRTENWSEQVERSKIGMHTFDRGAVGHKAAKMMKRAKSAERRIEAAAKEKASLLKNVETVEDLKLISVYHHKKLLIEGKELALHYGERTVCSQVNFTVENGQRVWLQGKNGCGKSSLLKLLMGEKIQYSGSLELAAGMKISYVPQDATWLSGELTDFAAEYGLEESLFKAILRKLDFSRIQFEKRMEDYSAGQKKKVLIAKSLCEQAHLYVWDEPLNYIDVFSRMQIKQLILIHQPTMIFVEHDRAFGEDVATGNLFL